MRQQTGFQLGLRRSSRRLSHEKDPLSLGVTAGDRYNQLAQSMVDARDKAHGGIVTSFDELKSVDGVTPAVIAALE